MIQKIQRLTISIINRIRSDFFICNRIADYEQIIKTAIDKNYEVLPLSEFFNDARNNRLTGRKILLIRHDIDSDPTYVLKWLSVNQKYGVRTSFYFRLCTLNYSVMKKVHDLKSDCGYHYEELATIAKRKKIRTKKEIEQLYPEIRAEFIDNFNRIEQQCGFKIRSIASHGDFANRILNTPNREFITEAVMEQCGIDFETYQSEITNNYSINITDCGYPNLYRGDTSVLQAIDQQHPIIHILIHPKHWRSSWYWNIYENGKRIIEGLKYR